MPNAIDTAFAHPLLAHLEPDVAAALRAAAREAHYAAGERVFTAGEAAAEVLFLVRGEVAIRRDGQTIALTEAPSPLGLLASIDERPRSANVDALTDIVVIAFPDSAFDTARRTSQVLPRALVLHLVDSLRTAQQGQFDMLQAYDEYYRSPGAGLIPGPYRFEPFPAIMLTVRHDPAVLASWLPEGLRPFPGLSDRYFLVSSFIDNAWTEHPDGAGKRFSYTETAVLVPCLDERLRPGAFFPELYPDAYLPIALGREVYGFPKRFGRTVRGDHRYDLYVGTRLVYRASWEREEPLGRTGLGDHMLEAVMGPGRVPAPLRRMSGLASALFNRSALEGAFPTLNARLHRQVAGDASSDHFNLQADELVEVAFSFRAFDQPRALLSPKLEFFDEQNFLGGEAVGAASFVTGFNFGASRVIKDYRRQRAGRFRFWR